MQPLDVHARAAENSELVLRVAELLEAHWDTDRIFAAPDGTRDPSAHARAVLGILAAGAPAADVVGYLRRAEEAVFGRPRSSGTGRWALATVAWRWSWGEEPLPAHGRDVPVPSEELRSPYRDQAI